MYPMKHLGSVQGPTQVHPSCASERHPLQHEGMRPPRHSAALRDGQGTGQCVTSPPRGVEQSCLRAADW